MNKERLIREKINKLDKVKGLSRGQCQTLYVLEVKTHTGIAHLFFLKIHTALTH
jgi:hypothetical protein